MATLALGFGGTLAQAAAPEESADQASIPRRVLGRTGERVSIVGLGGYHIGIQRDDDESIRIIRTALDEGINFLDNCWDYNGGRSELRMGRALRDGYRAKAFLMSKIDSHSRQGAARQIDESLKRLQTDHVDLMQFHEVIRPDDPQKIFAEDGALQAMLAAKKAGKVRYIGFTGHKSPEIHRHMLEVAAQNNFAFDAVQMPLNVMDAHYDSFEKIVLPLLVKQNIGVLGMKPLGAGVLLRSRTVTAVDCLHYAMSLPTSVVITGCDSPRILRQALDAARGFRPLSEAKKAELLRATATAAARGQYEPYKTTGGFDGTRHNPQWLK